MPFSYAFVAKEISKHWRARRVCCDDYGISQIRKSRQYKRMQKPLIQSADAIAVLARDLLLTRKPLDLLIAGEVV
jgi:hypothetical protein